MLKKHDRLMQYLDDYYVKANTNVCEARWLCFDILCYLVAVAFISYIMGAVATVASILSLVQYFQNIHGKRALISMRMNIKYGNHLKRFLNQHHTLVKEV